MNISETGTGAVTLDEADLKVVRSALADAITLIEDGAGGLRRVDDYEALLAKLGGRNDEDKRWDGDR
jgi:hypothetical protein